MVFTPRQMWWINFALFAIQALTGATWSAFDVNPHILLGVTQVAAYVQVLLHFIVAGTVPGIGMSERAAVDVPKLPETKASAV